MKRKQKGSSDLWIVLGLLLLILLSLALVSYSSCKLRWNDSGYVNKWGPIAGCRVSKDGKYWIPEDRVRETE